MQLGMKIFLLPMLVVPLMAQVPANPIYPVGMSIPNDTTTGTTLGYLTKLTSSGAAIRASTTDTSGILGCATTPGTAGTTGSITVAFVGVAQCAFDGTPTAGDYVENSPTAAGQAHDFGTSASAATTQCIGRVAPPATSFGGFYNVLLIPCGSGGGSTSPTATTNTLSASTTTPAVGASVILTSTVAPSAATGTVNFLDSTTVIGTVALSGGSAAYTVTSIAAGSHPYKANYSGDSNYSASTSNVVTVATPSAPHYFGGVATGGGATGATASGTTAVLTGATGTLTGLSTQTGTFSESPSSQYIYFILQGSTHTFTVNGFNTTFTATPISFTDANGVAVSNEYIYVSPTYYSGTYPVVVN